MPVPGWPQTLAQHAEKVGREPKVTDAAALMNVTHAQKPDFADFCKLLRVRPKADVCHSSVMLRRGPPDRTFAAVRS